MASANHQRPRPTPPGTADSPVRIRKLGWSAAKVEARLSSFSPLGSVTSTTDMAGQTVEQIAARYVTVVNRRLAVDLDQAAAEIVEGLNA